MEHTRRIQCSWIQTCQVAKCLNLGPDPRNLHVSQDQFSDSCSALSSQGFLGGFLLTNYYFPQSITTCMLYSLSAMIMVARALPDIELLTKI